MILTYSISGNKANDSFRIWHTSLSKDLLDFYLNFQS